MENYLPLFLRHQNAISIEMEDGLEVSIDNGLKLYLNGTAQRVWELTINPVSVNEIVKNIHDTYGQPPLLARHEVLQFLDDATCYGLISQFISRPNVSSQFTYERL